MRPETFTFNFSSLLKTAPKLPGGIQLRKCHRAAPSPESLANTEAKFTLWT